MSKDHRKSGDTESPLSQAASLEVLLDPIQLLHGQLSYAILQRKKQEENC